MKSPNVQNKPSHVLLHPISLLSEAVLPVRRFTDITPSHREMSEFNDVPSSPKVHELIERSKRH
jgi:hypothetical protein